MLFKLLDFVEPHDVDRVFMGLRQYHDVQEGVLLAFRELVLPKRQGRSAEYASKCRAFEKALEGPEEE